MAVYRISAKVELSLVNGRVRIDSSFLDLLLQNTPVSYSTPCMRLNQLNWLISPSLSPIHKTRYVIREQKRPMTSKCGCRILIKNWIYRAEKLINIVENDSLGLKERSSFVALLSKFWFLLPSCGDQTKGLQLAKKMSTFLFWKDHLNITDTKLFQHRKSSSIFSFFLLLCFLCSF